MKFLVATTNAGKVREFREILGSHHFDWFGLKDLPDQSEIEETGHTFRANAVLKASGYARATGLWTLADDSGLEVNALDKNPGIYSARWAAMHSAGSGDAANNALLLEQLKDVADMQRTGRFVCVLAVADPGGSIIWTTRATMEGQIRRTPVGHHGFGYDPLFQVAGLTQTSAQLSPQEKHRISHRGQALAQLKTLLDSHDFLATQPGINPE